MEGYELLKIAVLWHYPVLNDAAKALEIDQGHLSRTLSSYKHMKTAVKIWFKLKDLHGQVEYPLEEILEGYNYYKND